ncbi:DEAD/DEAH box helicase [Pseudoalteromonas fenneropenaei]|uniref:DEAD/DEAH box helicase n=1 Tax=Pseudoalteromonas fenneropenaei TaxID=1737459 RepID=A0ABV7CP02_9GAMM
MAFQLPNDSDVAILDAHLQQLPNDIVNLLKILAVADAPLNSRQVVQLAEYASRHLQRAFAILTPELKKHLIPLALIQVDHFGVHLPPLAAARIAKLLSEAEYQQLRNALQQSLGGYGTLTWQSQRSLYRHLIHNAIESGDCRQFEALLNLGKDPQLFDFERNQALLPLLFSPFEIEQFCRLSNVIQYQALATLFESQLRQGLTLGPVADIIEQVLNHNPHNTPLKLLLADYWLLNGDIAKLAALCPILGDSAWALQLQAALLFLQGEHNAALTEFENALQARQKYGRKKKQRLFGIPALCHLLTLLALGAEQEARYYDKLLEQVEHMRSNRKDNDAVYYSAIMLEAICKHVMNGAKFDLSKIDLVFLDEYQLFYARVLRLIGLCGVRWTNQFGHAEQQLANELAMAFSNQNVPLLVHFAEQLQGKEAQQALPLNIATLVSPKAAWETALERLTTLVSKAQPEPPTTASKPTRLVWELDIDYYSVTFRAKEQKATAKGWSKGRTVALERLAEHPQQFDYLTEQDKQLCRAIAVRPSYGYQRGLDYVLEGAAALHAAVNADNLILAANEQTIRISAKAPQLVVNHSGDDIIVTMATLPNYRDPIAPYAFHELKPRHWQFCQFAPEHVKIAEIVGEGGLVVPLEAKDKLLQSIAAIAPLLDIQSNLPDIHGELQQHNADNTLIINVTPYQQGLAFQCVIMPFGEQGPAFVPGIGNISQSAEINGKRLATTRDLAQEQQLLDTLDTLCPAFLAMSNNQLQQPELQAALETLEALQAIQTEQQATLAIKLRWPQGKKFSLSKRLESHSLQLAVSKKNEWFDLTGELQISAEQVIALKPLLGLVAASRGRFIALEGDTFLALSEELKQRLQLLADIGEQGLVHPLAIRQALDATTGLRMQTVPGWEELKTKMQESVTLDINLPTTLQASLREYQRQGFEWASRLAHWGAGACLADDMGLGKTLQALAVILSRAQHGPTLIIAPTSVCFNWQQEAFKFAPTLNFIMLAESQFGEARDQRLESLQPFDVVVISYGLLQRESEELQKIYWQTIVADEAQALKNPLAKRTVAAYQLKAAFKMVTTGTPIENNLTELWSLFRFINPGLLGNLKRFAARFALPIENRKEDPIAARRANQALKHLIQPFILRRIKQQVLQELPARTEINLQVTLSDAEMAFYEAIRQQAIESLSKTATIDNPGEQRLRMLAELVKLRQACCNPALLLGDARIPSSKLAMLDELVEELIENGHKALIFSQFVGHLQLIKQHLDTKGVRYQYLDGSTPVKARQSAVNAFQSGDGEVFLISLKAGGSGLNLTAADYVIHMDPWWNPAVEDQASDRAHRIGQKRPVTIYRLIAKHTIEEKIVSLHEHKRDLADKLLSDSDSVQTLSVSDMLMMLKETF